MILPESPVFAQALASDGHLVTLDEDTMQPMLDVGAGDE